MAPSTNFDSLQLVVQKDIARLDKLGVFEKAVAMAEIGVEADGNGNEIVNNFGPVRIGMEAVARVYHWTSPAEFR